MFNFPSLHKCLPIRFKTFNCFDAFLHIFETRPKIRPKNGFFCYVPFLGLIF